MCGIYDRFYECIFCHHMIDMLKYLQMNDAIKTQQNIHWRDEVADLFDANKKNMIYPSLDISKPLIYKKKCPWIATCKSSSQTIYNVQHIW